jgi:hypothetical protein
MRRSYILAGFILCSFAACKPSITSELPYANGLNFTSYVAVGDAFTAGFSDGALSQSGQTNSYPAILAEQFGVFGPIVFKQPLLTSDVGFPSSKLVLGFTNDCMNAPTLGPVPFSGAGSPGDGANISAQGPFNNLGIPFARVVDYVTPDYSAFNPFAGRIASTNGGTILDEVGLTNASFFTVWLGNNDVLGYAMSGGEGSIQAEHPDNLTSFAKFSAAYDQVVQSMTIGGAKGVLINIPDISSFPFFTTIPANGLVLDTAQATALNGLYAGSGITFRTGPNNFIIQDPNVPGGRRQIKNGEYLLLSIPQDSLKCGGWGTAVPIPKRYVLAADEVKAIADIIKSYNNYIRDKAIQHNLGLVDMNTYFKTIASGVKFNGVDYNAQYISGTAFSLDGIHFTPRGYAILANEILRTINAYYGSSIPMADANKYPGIKVP